MVVRSLLIKKKWTTAFLKRLCFTAKIKGKHCTEDEKPISIKNVCGSRIWQY